MTYFVECTHTYHTTLNSGIQRVVRNIIRSSAATNYADKVVPVVFEGDDFFAVDKDIPYPVAVPPERPSVRRIVARHAKEAAKSVFHATRAVVAKLIPYRPFVAFLYAPRTQWGLTRILTIPLRVIRRTPPPAPRSGRITSTEGDVLVLLDSSWHSDLWKAIDKHRKNGMHVVVVIYDLIPYLYPQYCSAGLVNVFNTWLQQAVHRIDAAVAISETVAKEFQLELPKITGRLQTPPAVSFFWLGSELDGIHMTSDPVKQEIVEVAGSGVPTYIYVSSIEPRKNHLYALDAFDILWKSGIKANFVIVGRLGWKAEEVVERVHGHEQFGKQLFMFNNVEDNELSYLYDNARGLIFTSASEGFGLPIVEGLQRGLPVFASDIPVFREIGRQGVKFADLNNPQSLAEEIATHVAQGAPRLQEPVEWLTWQQSAEQLFSRIDACFSDCRGTATSDRVVAAIETA